MNFTKAAKRLRINRSTLWRKRRFVLIYKIGTMICAAANHCNCIGQGVIGLPVMLCAAANHYNNRKETTMSRIQNFEIS